MWRAAAEASHVPICLSDPTAPDQPLVWVNTAFERVTGYRAEDAVGRNCRFLQGADTDPAAVDRIREALRRQEPVTETLLNHRRDGRPFWNRLSLSPLRDATGRVVRYVGVQDDVTAQVDAVRVRDAALVDLRHANAALAELSRREHQAALTLQTGLLPRLTPVDGVDVAARYVPSTVGAAIGGDWYDVVELPDGHVGIAVGDVIGHDLRAAAAMGQLRSMMRALAWTHREPARVLERLDELCQAVVDVTFATVFYGVLSPAATPGRVATLTWSRAGHPPPLLRAPDGGVTRLDSVVAPPIGLLAGRPVAQQTTGLPPGSALVLYTDGLVEHRDRDLEDGLTALSDVVRRAPAGRDAAGLRDAVVDALVPPEPADDTCVLVVVPVP